MSLVEFGFLNGAFSTLSLVFVFEFDFSALKILKPDCEISLTSDKAKKKNLVHLVQLKEVSINTKPLAGSQSLIQQEGTTLDESLTSGYC